MNNKLYIGNLPFSLTEDDLKGHFAQCGEVVSVKIITDKFSGRSKGFGFIEMSNEEEADAAIEKLNNSDLGGRSIRVDKARPQEPRTSNRPRGGGRP